MRLRVVKHEADEEKDVFKVVLKGQAHDLVKGSLIDVELKLKAKTDDILMQFPRTHVFEFAIQEG